MGCCVREMWEKTYDSLESLLVFPFLVLFSFVDRDFFFYLCVMCYYSALGDFFLQIALHCLLACSFSSRTIQSVSQSVPTAAAAVAAAPSPTTKAIDGVIACFLFPYYHSLEGRARAGAGKVQA